ncbi:hypothetical protein SAM23877_6486 [Streptomyces ambofaciens ATCC 23877]|uniref:Uncharacterized protein n=1 Tax=Streptomyces ambofaciens (strain ATCC 23877 / 3486 / DSM 40053 / JCM 4204 / NBRC 12836 / NRRL B-2516) TaxID=278992 RepID=A0AE85_STRA7|nr:hypothetical protein [Streptomyces ambofaciens]AKZ59531.1 hypothetical protein SAM23877_6486 [Streptomyces ambofaciens ATCC 23877]CAJ88794.1 conserved hypothetical protein [Streptomyces ambofaciens ATCC 23877]
MVQPPRARKPQKERPRRRARESGGPRSNRFLVSYNDDELAVLLEAAARDNSALASWVADNALQVAAGILVPVSADAKEVLREQVNARAQAARIGNKLDQMRRSLNAVDGTAVAHWDADDNEVTAAQVQRILTMVETAVRHLDEATLQVMRERRPRA